MKLRQTTRGLLPLLLVLLPLLLATGCRRGPALAEGEIEVVEHPDLTTAERVIREQIQTAREAVDQAPDRATLAEAFGGLGELYHTYDLPTPAAACYRNAAQLDEGSFLWPYYLGVLAQEEGDLEEAEERFRQALERRPEDPATRLRLAEVLLSRGSIDEASDLFRALLDDPTYRLAAHFGLGRATEDPAEAVEHLEAVLAERPGLGAVHHALGRAYRRLGNTAEAETHLAHEGGGEPPIPDRVMDRLRGLATSSGSYLKRGSRLLVNGELEQAEVELRRATEVDEANSAAWRNLAHAQLQQGKLDDVLATLREAAEALPEDALVHLDLGNAYLASNLLEQAVESFERAIELRPDLAQAHYNLANALGGLERWQEAEPHIARVLELEPDHSRAPLLAARADAAAGRRRQAIQRLEGLLEKDPTQLPARHELARILTDGGQTPRATAVYAQALSLDLPSEDRLDVLLRLAELEWRRNQRTAALGHWREAVELAPESSRAHTALANGLQLMNRRPEARDHFARAVEINPQNATAWLSEASLWLLDSEFETAKERLEQALEVHPKNARLLDTLARLLATCNDPALRDGPRALDLARNAFALESSVDHAETVGMALAEMGKFEEAIQWQQGLAVQAAQAQDHNLARRLVQRLKLYQNRQPVRTGG
jgi:tetratricopeptide (TPR) repeat protein